MRHRFPTWAVVALGALAAGALGIAASLAVSDAGHWPGWLRPYQRWGWPAVWVLLLAAAALAAWQATRQPNPPAGTAYPRVRGQDSGPVAAGDVTITGAQAPTAGRDAHTVTGATGPTAGGHIITTNITNVTAPAAGQDRPPAGDQQPLAKPISNLPPRNRAFTGRAELLDRLHQQLSATAVDAVAVTALPADSPATVPAEADAAPQVLHGLGGVGKTHLAQEYAHRHSGDYPIRWWITAEQPAAIPGQLAALARQLGIPEQPDHTVTVAALRAELGRRGGWLLVFDNAEDPHDLHPYWPPTEGGGRVLVTSRNPNWQPLAATLPVDVLPRADAIAFLQGRASLDQHDADRLAEALGDLPLALEQAAAYLEQTHTPPSDYLELMSLRARELFALGRPATSEQTIATTWSVSLQRMRSQTPAAEELLVLCAFLAPDAIPRSLFAYHPERLPRRLARTVRDPLRYQQAVSALGRYALATTSQDGQSLKVHRLVQAVVRHQLTPRQKRRWATVALTLVRTAFPERLGDPDAWPAYARLLPHALITTGHTEQLGTKLTWTASLLREAGVYLSRRADHAQARTVLERALALQEARLGARYRSTTTLILNSFAVVLQDLGDLDEARHLYERVLAIHKVGLRIGLPRATHNLSNLATVLHDQGDLQRARTQHERALATYEARLGPDHPDTAWSLSNLASVLRDQGDLHRARTLLERALSIREARLGPDHPDTAHSLNSLGTVLHAQGDLDHARTLHQRALAIREARLGPDHPDIADSLSNLAGVLRDLGDLDHARILHERALAIFEARLGADHPDTVRSREDLGAVVTALDKQR